MKYASAIALFVGAVSALPQANLDDTLGPDEFGEYTISSLKLTAKFIPYGASLTHLFVKDKHGEETDVVLGYDDVSRYPSDPGHPVYNAVPGRYVGRISGGMYELNGKMYHTEQNDGNNTLHSGTNNWSFRMWNVTKSTRSSLTFQLFDEAGSSEGFPGDVLATVTYSLQGTTWDIQMEATATEETPLMLTQHTYFNLDAYQNPATDKIWNHTLYMPYSSKFMPGTDDALPTGEIVEAEPGSIDDFASADDIQLGHASGNGVDFTGHCGAGGQCEGYNGYWLIEDAPEEAVVVTLASDFSGIKAELKTDQPGVIIYTCNWFSGVDQELKATQMGVEGRENVTRSSCVAIEAQDYPDGINHPEWDRMDAQITGPDETYTWHSSWTFGLTDEAAAEAAAEAEAESEEEAPEEEPVEEPVEEPEEPIEEPEMPEEPIEEPDVPEEPVEEPPAVGEPILEPPVEEPGLPEDPAVEDPVVEEPSVVGR